MKAAMTLGESDEFRCNVTEDPVYVRALYATILHQLGFDNNRLSENLRDSTNGSALKKLMS